MFRTSLSCNSIRRLLGVLATGPANLCEPAVCSTVSTAPVLCCFSPAARSYAKARHYPPTPALAALLKKHTSPVKERPVLTLEPRPWTPVSRRTGLIAIKAGMTHQWNEFGVLVPLTVLWVDDCQVVQVKTSLADGVSSLQLGCGSKRDTQVPRSLAKHYLKKNLPIKRKLAEFPVTEDAFLPVGTPVTAAHFVAGQYVDVTGTTKGKGFQGVMKRWGFAGMPASHGTSVKHRHGGSIGCRSDPGRVWKGKKMPGRMGGKTRTMHSCLLYKVDPERNLLYVRGQIPGQDGNYIYLRDAFRKQWEGRDQLPFPTFIGTEHPPASAARTPLDPYRVYQQDIGYFSEQWKGTD